MKRLHAIAARARRITRRRRPVILLYHRIAAIEHDPWHLAVPPSLFAEQMEALARSRRVVPLDRMAEAVERGRAPINWVAITFDDGYADLLTGALPAMQRSGCPATLFATTGVLDGGGFWWDRLSEAIFRPPRLPRSLELGRGERRLLWEEPPAGPDRQTLHLTLWRWLRRLAVGAREEELTRIEDWAGIAPARERDRALTSAELRLLAESGLFSIGAHSINHPSLPQLSRAEKAAEIAGSRRACEEILGRPVTSFAYPFGDMDEQSREEVRRAGFAYACSTSPEPVRPTSPRFALPRITVGAWTGDELLRRLT
jgi:peptidoglycan/xylan/chitin deacetylase (PgdA/CDA1 family)